ncbi:osmoprotectant NAGGN system M42 family peptidase [Aromatoleum evansii]|uniref:osmoprotectant NAGGN system M42 family peptidase n=1 Tax=Aromatoleum evansii TaxID=59406 RepID=UPI00145EE690|nr:osmoprotectant NAGGN system M42 family peptidase [Aromatoleum evansii]NMG29901.1 osmoprotectant NAGGN system M42 family peptidase [Aromatoleum evansii]
MHPDRDYLQEVLARLLNTPSPSGMTDAVVHVACSELDALGIPYELTRRGAIRACLKGRQRTPARAVVAHLDTLGAMVKGYKPNGRLQVVPIGFWSSRFAEGARVTIYSDNCVIHRGTLLPAKASGHTFNKEIDTQPVSWDNLELRVDARTASEAETRALGIHVGDTISVHSNPEFGPEGFINARHLDDKAGVAAILAALRAIRESGVKLPVDCFPLFTISEEIGVGASHVLHGDVAELISIDNGTVAQGQYTSEYGVTISMQDSSGPFDWHLTRRLLELCASEGIEHSRDVFRFYRSDAAAAIEAGNDIRTALVCFGLDASHGHERVHIDSLDALARLLIAYLTSPPLFHRDRSALGPLDDFPPAEVQTPDLDDTQPEPPHP